MSLQRDPSGPGTTRIGVVGGAGQMGEWLRRFWSGLGCEVRFSDRGTSLTNEELVRWARLTFVSVPLQYTPQVLSELAPLVGVDCALASIASLMVPSAVALGGGAGEALCAHPVFGPTVIATAGLPFVVAPVRGTRWADWLVGVLRGAGLAVHVATPADHDRTMTIVQSLLHSLYVALCLTMDEQGLAPADALPWASPTLHLQLALIARILGQDPDLYAGLVVGNPQAPEALESLADGQANIKDDHLAGLRDELVAGVPVQKHAHFVARELRLICLHSHHPADQLRPQEPR